MEAHRFVPEESIRERASRTFSVHKERIARSLPDADIQHVGGTSVPGALTKGDVDLAVRVSDGDFQDAIRALESSYVIHQPENWTTTYASFKEEQSDDLPVGIQLSVVNSQDDFFVATRDLLRSDTDLLSEYNALKSTHADTDEAAYLAAKDVFMEKIRSTSSG